MNRPRITCLLALSFSLCLCLAACNARHAIAEFYPEVLQAFYKGH